MEPAGHAQHAQHGQSLICSTQATTQRHMHTSAASSPQSTAKVAINVGLTCWRCCCVLVRGGLQFFLSVCCCLPCKQLARRGVAFSVQRTWALSPCCCAFALAMPGLCRFLRVTHTDSQGQGRGPVSCVQLSDGGSQMVHPPLNWLAVPVLRSGQSPTPIRFVTTIQLHLHSQLQQLRLQLQLQLH